MKSFITKHIISILVNLRYLRFNLLKYKEYNRICNTFDHNFKNIPLYIMRIYNENCIIEKYYFVLYDGALTVKMSKMVLNQFCDETLHIYLEMNDKTYISFYSHYEMLSTSTKCLPMRISWWINFVLPIWLV